MERPEEGRKGTELEDVKLVQPAQENKSCCLFFLLSFVTDPKLLCKEATSITRDEPISNLQFHTVNAHK